MLARKGYEKNSLSRFTPVTDLIMLMERECERLMKGTMFEGKGIYYYDTLSQLTSNSTIDWMKKMVNITIGSLQLWIVMMY